MQRGSTVRGGAVGIGAMVVIAMGIEFAPADVYDDPG
jgi:hypothetical protein